MEKPKKYSQQERVAALMTLSKNKNHLAKTAEQLGIARQTLSKWRDEYRDSVDGLMSFAENSEVSLIAENLDDRYRESQDKFAKAVEVVKLVAVKRIYDVIQTEKNLNFLSTALRTLHDIGLDGTEKGKAKKDTAEYLTMIQKQIVNMSRKKIKLPVTKDIEDVEPLNDDDE